MTLIRCAALAALALLGSAAVARPVAASTSRELFEAGNNAYELGRFDEAATAYEKILGYGVSDPRVLYNLANSYFKQGKLGAAILHYERALRLDPSDRDARDNLEFARGMIRDRVTESEVPYPVKVVQDVLDGLSANLVGAVFLLLYCAAGGLVGVLVLARGHAGRRALGYCAGAAGFLALVAGGALAYKIEQITAARAIVMEEKVDVLSGPAADNTVLFTVHEGTRLEVRNRRDGWYQVSLPNAMSGWVPSGAVEQV